MEEMISYVLFDPETGKLLGGYLQVPPVGHESRVPADDFQRQFWPYFELNEDRTALVRWWFEPPEVTPQPEPTVDPEPDEPVQSGN